MFNLLVGILGECNYGSMVVIISPNSK